MVAVDELKPCPFCGTTPFCGSDAHGWAVLCANSVCDPCPTTSYHDSEEKAIATWNTRVPDAALVDALVDALKTAQQWMTSTNALVGTNMKHVCQDAHDKVRRALSDAGAL
jgi:hypothetical protein